MDNHFQRRSMPPPPPPPVSPPEHDQDISLHDRYRRLKRRFIEMEQKFSAMYVDLQRAGEQNRRLARERDMLLDRIHEMNVLPTSPTSAASASLSTSTRPQMDRYVPRSAPPPIRSAREAALQRFLDEDSDDDVPPPPPRRPSVDDYDRREFNVNGNENGNRSNPIPDRDRYSYPPPPPPLPPPAGPVHSTSSRPIYSPESTPTSYPRYQSSAPPAIQNQLQNYHNPASAQSNHLHHSHHPSPPSQSQQHPNSIHEPYYSSYVHSGPRSRTPPPPVSPSSEYSWRKRPLERDEEVTSGKRIRTSQYQHQQQQQQQQSHSGGGGASGSLPKPVSSTSSQSGGVFVNGSPSPPIQGAISRGGGGGGARGKGGGRSRKGRAGSVSASSTTEAPVRKRRARQTNKPTRDPSVMPDDELDLERRSANYGIDTPIPGSSSVATLSSSARPGSVKQRSLSPPIPPPSMPTNIVRGGSSPSRSYSPAPPALPPTGPPPRDRISPVANTRNSSRSNNAPPPPLPPLALPRPRSTKPKRLKAHTVQSKSYSIPTVPRNPDGKPQLPLNVGIMTVRNLGKVCLEKHFHTERYIFPVGYEVTRRYFSMHNPEAEAQYTCTILHGSDVDGGSGPRFRIVASDNAEHPITAGTATGAWSVIVKAANKLRMRPHSNSVSGPDYFGLGQNTIKHLLQELDNANLLQDYVRQTFVEGGPLGGRHAAVTAAVNLDEKPPEATSSSSISHSRSHPNEHASKSSSPIDQRDDQERDGGSVIGADLDHEPEDGEGNEPERISPPPPPPPPPSIRSPRRRSGSGQHDEEDDGHSYHHSLPSITKFDQQPPISHQRGSPITAPPSHSRSPYHSHSPPSGQGIREREREREGERYGSSSSPSTLSGIRGLMNPPPRVSSEGSRSEYSPPNSRPGGGGGHGQGNPGDDYRDREEFRTTRMSTSPQ